MQYLYTEHPDLYDALQSEWDYDRDVAFVNSVLETAPETCRLLEIGCGTGEHTQRFVEAGYSVTAIDPNEGMLTQARAKTDATFHTGATPGMPVEEAFDVVVAIRGVINHLSHDELPAAVAEVAAYLAPGGTFIFDNSPLPPEGNHPAIDIATVEGKHFARIVQMNSASDRRLSWDQIVFTPEGEVFIDTLPMTPFDDLEIATALANQGFSFEPMEGYGPDDERTVFVCTQEH